MTEVARKMNMRWEDSSRQTGAEQLEAHTKKMAT